MKNNKGIAPLIVVLIVAGILALGGGGYVYVQSRQANKPVTINSLARSTSTVQSLDLKLIAYTTYRNDNFGFEISFPEKWKGYRAIENKSGVSFQLKLKNGEYSDVFLIDAYTIDWWNKNVSAGPMTFDEIYLKDSEQNLGNYLGNYIGKNDKYAFTYFPGQNDDGFSGFPDVVVGQPYEGPRYYINFILSTFSTFP